MDDSKKLVGQIEMHEFTDKEIKTNKTENFNVYLHSDQLPLFLFQVGNDVEDGDDVDFPATAHFYTTNKIKTGKENEFIDTGKIIRKRNNNWFFYRATVKSWREILSKSTLEYYPK